MHGVSPWATTIGLVRDGAPLAGLVVDHASGRRWWAGSSGPARVDGHIARPRPGGLIVLPSIAPQELDRACVAGAGGLGLSRARIVGCTSVDLCRVADGSTGAFVDVTRAISRVHDIAGAMAVLRGAGAVILGLDGRAPRLEPDVDARFCIVAAPTAAHVHELLAGHRQLAGDHARWQALRDPRRAGRRVRPALRRRAGRSAPARSAVRGAGARPGPIARSSWRPCCTTSGARRSSCRTSAIRPSATTATSPRAGWPRASASGSPGSRASTWKPKRYLRAVEPGYPLTPASVRSLQAQGGPLSDADLAAFREHPWWREAVALRRWDDEGKRAGLRVPGLESYRPQLREVTVRSMTRS